MSHPFPRGRFGLRSEAGLLAPGPTPRAFPAALAPSGCALARVRRGFPGHSGGSAPDSHRLPLTTDPECAGHPISATRAMTVNLTRIYTKLGDGGETHLGDMSRVPKTHPRIEAYGDVDELNAQIGVALTLPDLPEPHAAWLRRVQNDLFDVGADLLRARPAASASACGVAARADRVARGSACDEVNADARAAQVASCCRAARPRPRTCTSAAPSAAAPSAARSPRRRAPTPRSCATSTGCRTCSSSSRARATAATSRCGSRALPRRVRS